MDSNQSRKAPYVKLIWMQDIDGVIAVDGKLPFYLREDLMYFKRSTENHTVLMGRKTWESLPHGALPRRTNVVLTSNQKTYCSGAKVIFEPNQALNLVERDTLWVVGGAQLYKQLAPYAHAAYVTVVQKPTEIDGEKTLIDRKILEGWSKIDTTKIPDDPALYYERYIYTNPRPIPLAQWRKDN